MNKIVLGKVMMIAKGNYSDAEQYEKLDFVMYNGCSYVAKQSTIGNAPTNENYWQLLSAKGETGETGPQGLKGETGPTGNGISSIEKTSTSGLVDTYTITFTNGNTTTFDVSNGNGIDRIEKTATVGNKDTYTIYFTNGSTTTYEVSNGEVTREELEEEVDRLSMIYNAFPTTTGEGEEPSINGTAEVPFKEIGLKGNTSQDGTPTPDTPIPVNVVSGDNSINICGKNLFDKNDVVDGYYIDVRGNFVSGNDVFYSNFIPVLPNTPYTTSGKTDWYVIALYNKNKEFISRPFDNTITTTNETYYVRIIGLITDKNTIQFEKGSSSSAYTTYVSQTYPISLGNIELCKIDDYQDRIYKDNNKWYLEKNIGKVVLSGIEDIKNDVYNNIYQFSFPVSNPLNNIYSKTVSSNYFKGVDWSYSWEIDNSCVTIVGDDKIRIMTSKYTNVNDFKAFLKEKYNNNKPIICYYILATPIATEITDTTLLEQLDNLEKAYSYDTQTNISQTNQDKPFIISYEAILSLKNVLNNLETRIAVLETE